MHQGHRSKKYVRGIEEVIMKMLGMKCRNVLLGGALLGAVWPLVARSADAVNTGDSATLEEITVTAQKVKENLQRTPVSDTVVTADTIDRIHMTDITEVAGVAPNVFANNGFSGSSAGANFFIRGIGQEDFISTSDPGVGLFVDGVYMARTVGSALDTSEISQVDVLKGPQGTLFGKNTIGGAIVVTTKKPGDQLRGSVETTVGNLGRIDSRFTADVPLSDTLYLKLSGVTRNNDGFQTRQIDGVKLGDQHEVGGSIQLRWLPSPDLDVLLSADVTKARQHIAAQSAVQIAPSGGSALFQQLTGIDILAEQPVANGWQYGTTGVRPTDDYNIYGTSLNITKQFGFAELKSITAYRQLSEDTAADFDGVTAAYDDQLVHEDQRQFSQEFTLSHKSDALTWVLGAYYLTEHNREAIQNNFYVFWLVNPYGGGPTEYTDLVTDNFALYGQATYQLTRKLSVTAGLRGTYEKKDIDIVDTLGLGTLQPFNDSGSHHWQNVSPRYGIQYQATEKALLYASYTGGFKSGSYNGRADRQFGTFEPYGPERVNAWEGGLKSQWFDDRLRANAAAFFTHYEGIQLVSGALDQFGALYFPTINAGDVDIRGFELELQARPFEALSLHANAGRATEKWTDIYPSPLPVINDQSRLPGLSHWTGVVGGDYSAPLADFGSATIGANYSYRSSYFPDTGNSPRVEQSGFGLVDAHFIVAPRSDRWQVQLWAKNLTNRHYYTWGQDLIAIGDTPAMVFWGRPREYGVSLKINLGQ